MTEPIYLKEWYLKELDATVQKVEGKKIVLDKTIFYPTGGGQPYDTGTCIRNGEQFAVVNVVKQSGVILHEVDKEGLKPADKVLCKIDWQRRHALMRNHTAAHIIIAVINKHTGAIGTGNQLGVDQSRIDFNLQEFDREKMQSYIDEANKEAAKGVPVTTAFLTRAEAEKDPSLSKLAMGLPLGIQEIRVIQIGDIDRQADGGLHVQNTKEIGMIHIEKFENRGAQNKRLYFILK